MKGNWKEFNLGKLGKSYSGLSGKTKDDFGFGRPYIPYLRIFEDGKIDTSRLDLVNVEKNEKQNTVKYGDLFFTTSSETIEEVGMTSVLLEEPKENIYLNSFCFGFRLHNFEDVLPDYARYLFRGEEIRKKISVIGQGSTRYNLPKTILFEKLYLNVPNPLHQQKIAKILNTIDAVIDKTEQAIAKYQALKKGMMHDLFTRGIDLKTGKLRPNYEEAPELYKESKLGMIPKDWSVEPLSKLGVIKSGIDYKSNPKGNKFPIYGTGGIMGWTSLYLNSGPAVLTGRKGTINNPLFVEDKFWNVDTIFCINSINTKETDIKWLFYQFRNTDLTKLNEATGVPSVNSSALYKLLFKTPLFKEQEEIQFRITKIDTLIEKEKENLKKHQKIKKGLMQDLLTGKVEVKV